MRIIGFDPGITKCGYGVVDVREKKAHYCASGSISNPARHSLAQRLANLQAAIYQLLEQYSPHSCAVEDVFGGKDIRATLRLGMAHGIILAVLGTKRLSVAVYSPSLIKKAIAGNGRATKETVALMTQRHLNMTGSFGPDSTDALAVALTHFYTMQAKRTG